MPKLPQYKLQQSAYGWVSLICRLLWVVLLLPGGIQAQTQNPCNLRIYGYVKDPVGNEVLPYSVVSIPALKVATAANDEGLYQLDKLCAGTYVVVCTHVGCSPVTDTITLTTNDVEHNFWVSHTAQNIDEVSIEVEHGNRPTQQSQKLEGKALEQTRGLGLAQALSRMNGVSMLSSGGQIAKPVIRGLHGNRVLILNNGVRQEGQQWGSEHAPEIDPYIATQLTVVRGAASIRYGYDAPGGVILVQPAPLQDTAGIAGEVNFSAASANGLGATSFILQGSPKKVPGLAFRGQATGRIAGNTRTPNYYLKNTGLQELNFSATAGYKRLRWGIEAYYSRFSTQIGILSAAHIGNLTDLKQALGSSTPSEVDVFRYTINRPNQKVSHDLAKLEAYLRTGTAGKLLFTFARQYNQRMEYDKHRPKNDSLAALNRPELEYHITTYSGEVAWQQNPTNRFTTTTGIQFMTQANTYKGRLFIPNFRSYGIGAFVIERICLSCNLLKDSRHKLDLELGARIDFRHNSVYTWQNNVKINPVYNYIHAAGNIGLQWQPNPKLLVVFNASTTWRPPSINEQFSQGLHHGAAAIETGNPNLKPERSYNLTLDADWHPKKFFALEAGVFYNIMQGFIYLAPTLQPVVTIRGVFPAFEYRQINAHLRGGDLTFNFYVFKKRLNLSSRTTLLFADDVTHHQPLILMPPHQLDAQATWNFKPKGKITESYVGVSGTFVLRQYRTPPNSDYAPTPASYALLNANAGITVAVRRHRLSFHLLATNLTDAAYRSYMNRFRYYADEAGINAQLNIRWSF